MNKTTVAIEDQMQAFTIALVVSLAATVASVGAGRLLGAEMPGLLELFAVFTSFGSTILFVLQKRQCYVWGVVTTILYAALFWQFQLPASAAVQIYLVGALLYGYWRWGPDGDTRPVTLVSPAWWWLVYFGATGATYAGAWWISSTLGSPLAGWDGAILALSILAQWLLDNKKLETWIVWISVNVVAIPVYWAAGLSLVSAQYVLFLLNAFFGFYMWWKSATDKIAYGRQL